MLRYFPRRKVISRTGHGIWEAPPGVLIYYENADLYSVVYC